MATTFTTNLRLQKPATADRNWDIPINANSDRLDGLTAIGGLAVASTETPSTSLNVSLAPGTFLQSTGTICGFPGTPIFALPPSATTAVWLVDGGTARTGPAFPATPHVRLAQIQTGGTNVTAIIDARIQCGSAASSPLFVATSGGTITGAVAVQAAGHPSPVLTADPVAGVVSFFGATPAGQVASLAPLTDNSTGLPTSTISDVGPTHNQSLIDANFSSLTAKVNALIAALKHHGLMSN